MSAFTIVSVLIFLSVLFGYVNSRFLKLPPTIGLMIQALVLSLLPVELQYAGVPGIKSAQSMVSDIVIGNHGRNRGMSERTTEFLTWAGLRRGIAVALVLSLPPGPRRSTLAFITYVVVVFSILEQGTTVKYFVNRRLTKASPPEAAEE